jgi:glycosyltransferase involved in cell wall biosynthesis
MPPLEAMQAGVPVITSNNSSLPEVVGDAAITIDCNSEEQCIKAFEDFYFREDLRRMYIQRGFDRVKLFSWRKTVKIIKNVITHEDKDEKNRAAL